MKTYKNNESAPYGVYLSSRPADVRFVSSEGEAIDGLSGAQYRRLPGILVLAAGPILGGLFVLAFPMVIFAAFGLAVVRLVKGYVKEHSYMARMGWEPVASHLNNTKQEPTEKGTDEELVDLAEEVRQKTEKPDEE